MNNIKKIRKNRNLSQEYISRIMEVSQNTISQWETDTRTPSVKQAIRLAKILNATVEELYK